MQLCLASLRSESKKACIRCRKFSLLPPALQPVGFGCTRQLGDVAQHLVHNFAQILRHLMGEHVRSEMAMHFLRERQYRLAHRNQQVKQLALSQFFGDQLAAFARQLHLGTHALEVEHQIKKLRGRALALADQLEWIIQCFGLVQFAFMDIDLETQFTGNNRSLGFRILRIRMARYCILEIVKLTYDREPRNPTAGRLIEAIIAPAPTISAKT
jgi:hypothetical protein